jgi:hypothetical protein
MEIVNEIWKEVKGFERYYRVSSIGRIMSIRTNKILKISLTKEGYNRIELNVNGNAQKFSLHRIVALSFIPEIDGKQYVNHINNIRNDNRIENLEWCTAKENQQHCIKEGRKPSIAGNKNAMSILTEQQVVEIRRLKLEGKRNIEIARQFNLDEKHISLIVLRKRWKHI